MCANIFMFFHALLALFMFYSSKNCYLNLCTVSVFAPCPPIESIMRLMTVWRKTGKIIRTAIFDTYAQL